MIGAVRACVRALYPRAQEKLGKALPSQAACAESLKARLVDPQDTLERDALAPKHESLGDLLGPILGIDIAHVSRL